jgi:exodeoxyribonuclease VII small subunit
MSNQTELGFEKALSRLEEILEKMNSGTTTLDESLALFEEADKLINSCNKRLNEAEKKIEVLIKNRNGDLVIGNDQKPATQNFKDYREDT